MIKKTLALLVLALVIPGAALAARTQHQNTASQSKAAAKVMYILKGTLWNYTPATSTADGSITINVTHSNYHARALVGKSLTFAIAPATSTTLANGTISNGAKGIVKFKALRKVSNTTLLAALAPNQMTARQVIDQG